MATKAMNLEPALTLAPAQVVGDAIVIPLLNGVDHVQMLFPVSTGDLRRKRSGSNLAIVMGV